MAITRHIVTDALNRPLRDLRISVTDRCNFRCTYCMPREVFGSRYPFLPRSALLSFEEIVRLVRLFAARGVTKVRLTGGEPLLRRGLPELVARVAVVPGIEDIALTTNGALLDGVMAHELADAGLKRVTVSLDALEDRIFMTLNDVDFPVDRALRAIDHAAAAGLDPIKINAVIKRGLNDGEILPLASHFRNGGHIVRFIEYMDVGTSNGWCLDHVVSAGEIVRRIHAQWPLEAIPQRYPGEVANRWRYRDGKGEIGVIAAVTQPFCGGCTRLRLSAEGSLYTCLFAGRGFDLRDMLRAGAADEGIGRAVDALWHNRRDRYSELRERNTAPGGKVEMSYIGG